MKVLVASSSAPGRTDDDVSWTVDGELVCIGLPCCTCPGCGCTWSVAGLASSKATSMFKVFNHPTMTKEEYLVAFQDGLTRQGWLESGDSAAAKDMEVWAEEHLAVAASYPDGTDLQIVDGRVAARAGSGRSAG